MIYPATKPTVLYNPYTGAPRDPRDVASDPQATLLVPPTGPSVTQADVDAEIVSEFYFTAADGVLGESKMGTRPAGRARSLELMTFCVLVLRNGFTVRGVNACVSHANFNAETGRSRAREDAVREVWKLLGFRLCDELARPVLTEADALADLNGTPRPARQE